MKFLKFLILVSIIIFCTTAKAVGFLLKSPPPISENTLNQKLKTLSMAMSFESNNKNFTNAWKLIFEHNNGKTMMTIQAVGDLPKELAQSTKFKWKLSRESGQKIWSYTYTNIDKSSITSTIQNNVNVIYEPLVVNQGKPQVQSLKEVVENLQDKRVVFYTGAGISANVVPTMSKVIESLHLKHIREEKDILTLVQNALHTPTVLVEPMNKFYQTCFYGKPTEAHKAIQRIVLKKNWGLLTENLDLLHQRTGIEPLHRNHADWLQLNVSPSDLKKIDYVITVGLESDESGFLGWYKYHNPKGKVIAINLQKPNYLSSNDILFLNDAQILLPELFNQLNEKATANIN